MAAYYRRLPQEIKQVHKDILGKIILSLFIQEGITDIMHRINVSSLDQVLLHRSIQCLSYL